MHQRNQFESCSQSICCHRLLLSDSVLFAHGHRTVQMPLLDDGLVWHRVVKVSISILEVYGVRTSWCTNWRVTLIGSDWPLTSSRAAPVMNVSWTGHHEKAQFIN